jgi:hypothetical protein
MERLLAVLCLPKMGYSRLTASRNHNLLAAIMGG